MEHHCPSPSVKIIKYEKEIYKICLIFEVPAATSFAALFVSLFSCKYSEGDMMAKYLKIG